MAGLSMWLSSRWPRADHSSFRRQSARAASALPLAFCAQAFGISPGLAQEPPDTLLAGDSLLVVVGSRARIQDPVQLPVPVDIYGSEELSRLGDIDLGEALARMRHRSIRRG